LATLRKVGVGVHERDAFPSELVDLGSLHDRVVVSAHIAVQIIGDYEQDVLARKQWAY
jgi:hypothetical protein